MEDTNKALISCIRAALSGEHVACDMEKCMPLAFRHGVTNLLYYAIAKEPSESVAPYKTNLKQQAYAAVLREVAQQAALEELYRRFEASKIRCVALKGIVLKHLYPKREMRYMSDIDILIDPANAAAAYEHLKQMGWTEVNYETGDTDSYRSPGGLNLEIKKDLKPEAYNPKTEAFLGQILALSKPMEGFEYVCSLPNEEHYAYLLCHIVKHMLNGGVGIRPIMDIWICKNHMPLDQAKLTSLLEKLQLTTLAQTIEHLASVWFDDAEMTPIDDELGDYIVNSGAFGTEEHRVADRMLVGEESRNKFVYMWSRFFLPYRTMRNRYPTLRKLPILLPFFWIWRMIYALLFRGGKLKEEVGAVGEANQQLLQDRLDFYNRCGINIEKSEDCL